MPLFLLDRDGVVVVNRPTNVKTPDQLALIPGAAKPSRGSTERASTLPSALTSLRWHEVC
jgi:histidinol phosphatase-like enzyme